MPQFYVLKLVIFQKCYLDVSVSLIENHFNKLWVFQCVQEVRIQAVEVGLNADTLHDQVLRDPGHEFFFHSLFQLLHLQTNRTRWFRG